jgi:hypothetical protein
MRQFIIFANHRHSSCRLVTDGKSDDADDAGQSAQLELCKKNCLKLGCDPTIDFGSNFEQQCTQHCADNVSDANEGSCTEVYQALLECIEPLSCQDYYLWVEQKPDAPCTDEEQALDDRCPQVGVRK